MFIQLPSKIVVNTDRIEYIKASATPSKYSIVFANFALDCSEADYTVLCKCLSIVRANA